MKICWDNLEGVYLTRNGNLKKGSHVLYEKICRECGEDFLGGKNQSYCCTVCSKKYSGRIKKEKYKGKGNPFFNKKHTKETKEKIRSKKIGKKNPKRSAVITGKNNPNWKGGYGDVPLYDTYAHQISWCEPVRRNKEDSNILEVKCAYCGKWFIPTWNQIHNRTSTLNGMKKDNSENRLYCSDSCKEECPIYKKTSYILMKEDAIRAGRLNWIELNREVQPELRQMVFKRDDYKCIKCGSKENLHCHHIEGIRWEPLESADIDKCITVCKTCHKEIHMKKDCGYNDLKCKEI